MPTLTIAAFYKFTHLDQLASRRETWLKFARDQSVIGTILLAEEGVNGTIAGPDAGVTAVLDLLRQVPALTDLTAKRSYADKPPFHRMSVKLKREIVSLGQSEADPRVRVGTYVTPEAWNLLLKDPEITLIDTRNDYEVAIGKFRGAVDPQTSSFREFPDYVDRELDPERHKRVAMYCTGGIRCEKATALMLARGFEEVYHLKGGILKYLEDIEPADSLWEGECFVFDHRVSVDHDLNPGQYDMCHACRHPIEASDREHRHFVQGVSCPYCWDKTSPEQKAGFAERQRQRHLARERADGGEEV